MKVRVLGEKIKKVWLRWIAWRDRNKLGLPLLIIGVILLVIGFLMG